MLFVQYPKCTTCKKAEAWLKENKIDYESRHIKDNHPTGTENLDCTERSACEKVL